MSDHPVAPEPSPDEHPIGELEKRPVWRDGKTPPAWVAVILLVVALTAGSGIATTVYFSNYLNGRRAISDEKAAVTANDEQVQRLAICTALARFPKDPTVLKIDAFPYLVYNAPTQPFCPVHLNGGIDP